MSERKGLGTMEGAELLAHVAQYVPSLRPVAAAALLGAVVDDPHVYEAQLTAFVDPPGVPSTVP